MPLKVVYADDRRCLPKIEVHKNIKGIDMLNYQSFMVYRQYKNNIRLFKLFHINYQNIPDKFYAYHQLLAIILV